MVAKLIDGYLAEVAPDVNLKLPKFESLAAAVPDYARPLDDGLYRAIDIYLKEYSVEIYEWSGKSWKPYVANDVQLQFYMMSPYVLKTLSNDKKGLYSTSFKVPDVYGVFQFKVEYQRLGYTSLSLSKQAHPWLTDSEREQLCRLMYCQKLSLEACTHATQNERLPLRVVVQVLFFEQLQLRTSIGGCFLVSESLDVSRPLRSGVAASTEGGGWVSAVRENQVLKVGMDNSYSEMIGAKASKTTKL